MLKSVLVFLIFLTSCDKSIVAEPTTQDDDSSISILFVGNSLTYTNNMPSILTSIGKNYEVDIKTECICVPNSAIMDHWDNGNLKAIIENGDYDYVILQQGPSSQPYGRSILIEYGQYIKDHADKFDAITAFYMVWPAVNYYHTFDAVIESYTMAADQTGSLLFPAGAVWKNYILETEDNTLYDSDLFHPSKKGSFLAAWVIFHSIYPDMELAYNSNYMNYINEVDFEKMNISFDAVIND